jgi:hypothetical protein
VCLGDWLLTIAAAADLIVNFAQGLKDAGLKPKRFLLQTGAKHYGFHIGPATNPSFETDKRVLLENNFYVSDDAFAICDILTHISIRKKMPWTPIARRSAPSGMSFAPHILSVLSETIC